MSHKRRVWVTGGIVCYMLAVQACVPSGVPTLSPLPAETPAVTPLATSTALLTADPDTVAAQLTPGATLDQAAEQFAATVGTTKDEIRVRVYAPTSANSCYDCDKLPAEYAKWEHKGVPLGDVPLPLSPGSAVWLTAQGVECRFSYNGTELVPRYCQNVFVFGGQDRP